MDWRLRSSSYWNERERSQLVRYFLENFQHQSSNLQKKVGKTGLARKEMAQNHRFYHKKGVWIEKQKLEGNSILNSLKLCKLIHKF